MVSSNRLRSAFNKATRGNEKRNTYRAKLGDFNRRLQTGRTNYVWARVQLPDGLSVTEVLCMNVAPTLNLDVLVEYNEYDKLEVKKLDPVKAPEFFGDLPGGNVGAHGWSHGRLAPDAMKIDPLQIDGLLVTPTDPASSAVQMGSWFYQSSATSYEWWAGGTVDLTGYIPTDSFEQRPVIVGLNRSTGSPQVLVGTTGLYVGYTPYQIPFNGSDVAAIVGSADFEASAGVRLRYGMGSVEAYDLFLDCRRWVGGGISTGGGGSSSTSFVNTNIMDGVLTLESGVAYPKTDQTAKTTLYYTPIKSAKVTIYNTTSSVWEYHTLTEVSISVPSTTNTMYDVFFDGTSLELVAWTDDTTRATALGTQDNIPVQSGAANKRHIGMMRTTGVSGQTETATGTQDANWYVTNRYNKKWRYGRIFDNSTFWNSSNTSWERLNTSSSNRYRLIYIDDGDPIDIRGDFAAFNSTGSSMVGYGVDSITVNSAQKWIDSGGAREAIMCEGQEKPSEGMHYIQALQRVNAGTAAFYGIASAGPEIQSGFSIRFKA